MEANPEKNQEVWKRSARGPAALRRRQGLLRTDRGIVRIDGDRGGGVFLGTSGYVLGARRPGSLAVVLCAVAVFVGLPLVGPGAAVGDAYDPAVDGWFRDAHRALYRGLSG